MAMMLIPAHAPAADPLAVLDAAITNRLKAHNVPGSASSFSRKAGRVFCHKP
jgi:hypothetical protein